MPGPSLASLGLEVAVWSPRLGIQRIYRDPGPGFRRGREKATEQPGAALEQARAALHRELVVKPNILSTQFCKLPHSHCCRFLGAQWGGWTRGAQTGSQRKNGDLACCSPGSQRISREATVIVGNVRREGVAERQHNVPLGAFLRKTLQNLGLVSKGNSV